MNDDNTLFRVTPELHVNEQSLEEQQQPTTYFEVICDNVDDGSFVEVTGDSPSQPPSPSSSVVHSQQTVVAVEDEPPYSASNDEEIASLRKDCMTLIKASVQNLFFTNDMTTLKIIQEASKNLYQVSGGDALVAGIIDDDHDSSFKYDVSC